MPPQFGPKHPIWKSVHVLTVFAGVGFFTWLHSRNFEVAQEGAVLWKVLVLQIVLAYGADTIAVVKRYLGK